MNLGGITWYNSPIFKPIGAIGHVTTFQGIDSHPLTFLVGLAGAPVRSPDGHCFKIVFHPADQILHMIYIYIYNIYIYDM